MPRYKITAKGIDYYKVVLEAPDQDHAESMAEFVFMEGKGEHDGEGWEQMDDTEETDEPLTDLPEDVLEGALEYAKEEHE
jgi:hypothetical protein